jgi:hypothetical protein
MPNVLTISWSMPMDQRNDTAAEDATDRNAEEREQEGLEILREGRLDSTYIDTSRHGVPLSEDEFIDESGD